MATQEQIARRVGLDVSSVNKILNKRAGASFRKETVRKVLQAARELGYDLQRLKHRHIRKNPRKEVSVPLEVSIYLDGGRLFDRGTAQMRNVSLSGAVLSGIILPQQSMPLQPHTIGIRLLEGPLKGTEIMGRPVRFTRVTEGLALAIEFLESQQVDLKRLRKIV
jgi:transcriptional regulator with XRE-family HTH domain